MIGIMLVQGKENARLILGTIVGSIISLMVFSFSMVMLVLNRASATLSPRVIPGLITNKSHQIILGIYLGTIIYSLILIINIQSADAAYQIPSLGILLSMAFAITCLGLFVYFIHSISRSIQVDSILDSIFDHTEKQMEALHLDHEQSELPDTNDWQTIYTNVNGYIKRVKTDTLMKICIEHGLTVAMMEQMGFFLVKGYPFLKVNKKIEQEIEDDIRNCFIFYIEERVTDHYLFGFKQISEIAVKALSPGINDPGTAIKAIDMLTVLFIRKMTLNEKSVLTDQEDKVRVVFRNPTLEELLYINLTPIREYGKSDATVMLNLLESLKNMVYADKEKQSYQPILAKYINSIISSVNNNIKNELDVEELNRIIDRINNLLSTSNQVAKLKISAG